MERKKETLIIATSFISVVGLELLAHWLLASSSPNSLLRSLYLSSSKKNSITMLVDAIIPSVILGLITGRIGYQWPARRLHISASLLVAGILGSLTLYRLFFRQERLWWWPPGVTDFVFWLLTTVVFMLFFTYLGRNFGLWNAAGRPSAGSK